jgi:TolB-like protein/Flp pilus assembly protein TadD
MATFSLKAFLREARRRRVFRVTAIYIVGAWIALQAADLAFPGLGIKESAILYVWIGAILGLPIALFFGWRYDIIGGRIVRTAVGDVDADLPIERADYVILVSLSLVVAVIAFGLVGEISKTRVPETTQFAVTDIDPNSIAVLPFVNMSSDPEQEYFSDGVSEELLNVLSKLPGLLVVARTSSFQFRGEDLDIIDIGQQLNVGLVLEGSVRKAGNQVRITAQLIDARNGFHLWSETYDRNLENIFALQDEVSTAIVGAVKGRLGLEVEAIPRVIAAASVDAHDAYLTGRYLMVQRTPTSIEGAIREYEKAISLDPDYALAHAELSIAIVALATYAGRSETDAVARAVPHAERAMDLDPGLAEAHYATGLLLELQGKNDEGLRHARRAIQINPNYVLPRLQIAGSLDRLGRYAEFFVEVETAVRLDPLSIPARGWYINGLIYRNRLDEAERELEKLAPISPVFYTLIRGRLDSRGGKWANGILACLESWRIDPTPVYVRRSLSLRLAIVGLENEALAVPDVSLVTALRFLGRHADAAKTAEALLADDPISIYGRSELGMALAAAGDYERARPILEELWQQSGGRVIWGGVFDVKSAAALIAIRRNAGEEDGVGELLAAMRDDVRRLREAGVTHNGYTDYKDGLVSYLAGERTSGLALLAKAVEQGDTNEPGMAYLQPLYDDPGYAPILAREEAIKARERSRFLAVVCTDNPYAAFWQPAEGTCEKFAAAGRN